MALKIDGRLDFQNSYFKWSFNQIINFFKITSFLKEKYRNLIVTNFKLFKVFVSMKPDSVVKELDGP